MTKEEYQALIPPWCKLRTVEEHAEAILYCWSVTAGFAQKESNCSQEGRVNDDGTPSEPCEFYNPDWR